ncbi:hypothetical protein IP65_17775 [Novosphingobium sp. AAP1]|nr:hypothetical protein IP65_17775 [Novosphingobium sp. AAP1]
MKHDLLGRYQNIVRGVIGEQQRRSKDDKWRVIRGRSAIRSALLNIREHLPRSERESFFAWLSRLSDGLGPEFYSSLSRDLTTKVPDTKSLSVESELEWISFRLSNHIEDLKAFRAAVERLNDHFWAEDVAKMGASLKEIRQSFGPSLWLLSAELAFEQEFHGLEAQKKVLENTLQLYPSGLPAYLSFFYSIRNEERSTYRIFSEDYRKRLAKANSSSGLKIYLEYKVLGVVEPSSENISTILRIEQAQSIFDIYETTIDLLQQTISTSSPPAWLQSAINILAGFAGIGDWRVGKLLCALGNFSPSGAQGEENSGPPALGDHPARAFWGLVEGRIAESELVEQARHSREKTLAQLLLSVIRRDDSFEDSLSRLVKISRNFAFLPSPKAVGSIADFLTSVPLASRATIAIAALNDKGAHAIDLLSQNLCVAQASVEAWQLRVGPSEALKWAASNTPPLKHALCPMDWILYALRAGDVDPAAATEILRKIPRSSMTDGQRLLLTNFELKFHLDAGDWRAALKAIASELARSIHVITIVPTRNALAGRQWDELQSMPDKLDLAIALYAYWKQTDDSLHATFLRFSFEEVLFENGWDLPSSISVDQLEDNPRLVFFLEHICIPQLMDTSGFFASTEELSQERLAVLRLLAAACEDRRAEFEQDIDAINAARMLKSGLELVDSNRVTVDVPGLTRWASRTFRESYSRYQALQVAGIGINAKFEEIVEQVRSATDLSGEYFSIPTSEADTLLLEIILGLKDKFLSDEQYGLEYFLGKRIRHGTIAGHMRSPVEVARLITERRTARSPYERNAFWIEHLGFASDAQRDAASATFDSFSERYDLLISDVRDNYLHVRSGAHPKGLFEIAVTAPQFHILKAFSTSDADFDDFVHVCIQTFWGLLSPSLTRAREFLTSDIRESVVQLFGELHAGLEAASETPDCVQNAVIAIQRASTEVQRELDTVGAWFQRVEGRGTRTFRLKLAVEIAVQSSLKSLGTFRPKIVWNVPDTIDTTQSVLLVIWEFVFVALDNAFRRARAGNEPEISICCQVNETAKRLRLSITNPVGDQLDLKTVEAKLTSTREKIAAGDIMHGASSDRGSGLLKVASFVREYPSGTLDFKLIAEPLSFLTEMEIPVIISLGTVTLQVPEGIAR